MSVELMERQNQGTATHAGNGPVDDMDSFITPFTVKNAAPRSFSRFFFARWRHIRSTTQMMRKRISEPAMQKPTNAIMGILVFPSFASVMSERL